MDREFGEGFSTALLEFNREAVLYCHTISDAVAHEYAMDYVRMLQSRMKGVDASLPRIPSEPFEPSGNLIRATLDRFCEKYFPSQKN